MTTDDLPLIARVRRKVAKLGLELRITRENHLDRSNFGHYYLVIAKTGIVEAMDVDLEEIDRELD